MTCMIAPTTRRVSWYNRSSDQDGFTACISSTRWLWYLKNKFWNNAMAKFWLTFTSPVQNDCVGYRYTYTTTCIADAVTRCELDVGFAQRTVFEFRIRIQRTVRLAVQYLRSEFTVFKRAQTVGRLLVRSVHVRRVYVLSVSVELKGRDFSFRKRKRIIFFYDLRSS